MKVTVRALLSLILAGVVIATTGVVNLIVDHEASDRLQRELDSQFNGVANQMADSLDKGMYDLLRNLVNVSGLPTIRDLYGADAELQRNILETMKRTYEHYVWVGLMDTNGTVLRSTNKSMEGTNLSDQSWWSEGLRRPFVSDVQESDGQTGEVGVGAHRFISLVSPVRDAQGRAIGVMRACLNWNWAGKLAENLLRHQSQALELFVLSREGSVLLAPEPHMSTIIPLQKFPNLNKRSLISWPDGELYMTGYSATQGFRGYPGNGWVVVVRQNAEAALSPVRQLSAAIWSIGGAVTILFAFIGAGVASRISHPLRILAASAHTNMQTATPASFPTPTGPLEIKHLANALNNMLDQIRSREETLERQYAELDLLYEGPPIGIVMMDQDLNCLRMNSKLAQWCGIDRNTIVGRKLTHLSSDLLKQYQAMVAQTLHAGEAVFNVEAIINTASSNTPRSFLATCLPLNNTTLNITAGAALLISEMTAQRQAEYYSTHDPLTGLPNRRFLNTFINQELAVAHRHSKKLALLFLDLDRFKAVNDNFGHDLGDALLREVANRLRRTVRQSDLVFRLGGDEFVVVAFDFIHRNDTARLAKSIIINLSKAYSLCDHTIVTSPSIGIAIYPDDANDDAGLLSCADKAMYNAKKEGRGCYCYYSPTQDKGARA